MFKFCFVLLIVGVVVADKSGRSRYSKDPIKQPYLKRHARQAPQQQPAPVQAPQPQQPVTIAVPTNMAEQCTAAECNNRGTCFGTKQSPICLCSLGYAGTRCEETYCDNARDCNGRGLCMGTSSRFTCLCNFGFTGERCDTETSTGVTVPAVSTSAPQQNIPSKKH
uniref:EGF-like domain-containing protein n=1 Tax=Panagrolaimus sp. PS1159 TaxID=55785 RepID=A0AC35FCW2_9BILA